MSDIKRILLATDGSAGAERAFRWAMKLALTHKAELLILAVVEMDQGRAVGSREVASAKDLLSGRAEEFEAVARAAGVGDLRRLTEVGLAYSRILDRARREDADLIVIGARGYSGEEAGLGEVSSHVVEFANVSVLVVR
jgi:nucleotide-binding universal stress UspA family protein